MCLWIMSQCRTWKICSSGWKCVFWSCFNVSDLLEEMVWLNYILNSSFITRCHIREIWISDEVRPFADSMRSGTVHRESKNWKMLKYFLKALQLGGISFNNFTIVPQWFDYIIDEKFSNAGEGFFIRVCKQQNGGRWC